MARVKFRTQSPPGDWRFFEVRTKLLMKDTSIDTLIKQVIEHRKYKGLEPTDPESVGLEIERQICARLGTDECVAEGVDDEWVPIDSRSGTLFSFNAIMGFSKAAIEWMKSGREVVSMAELQRRREICVGCALNNPASGCSACTSFYNIVAAALPADRKFDDLHVCSACGCSAGVKAQLPISAINVSNDGRDLKFPKWCWQNPASPAYVP